MGRKDIPNVVTFYLIFAFYERLLENGKIDRRQYEKACKSLAVELNCKHFVF